MLEQLDYKVAWWSVATGRRSLMMVVENLVESYDIWPDDYLRGAFILGYDAAGIMEMWNHSRSCCHSSE